MPGQRGDLISGRGIPETGGFVGEGTGCAAPLQLLERGGGWGSGLGLLKGNGDGKGEGYWPFWNLVFKTLDSN